MPSSSPFHQPRPQEYRRDISAYLPSHITPLSLSAMRGEGESIGANLEGELANLLPQLTAIARTYRELLIEKGSGLNRFGFPIFWDTFKDSAGKDEVFKVSVLPLRDFKFEIAVRRYRGVEVTRASAGLVNADLGADISLRANATTTDEGVIQDASSILAAEQQAMVDRDGIPFRIALTAESVVETLSITVSTTERFSYAFARPQLHESLFWSSRFGKVSATWSPSQLKNPDLEVLERQDDDIVGDETEIAPNNPVRAIERGMRGDICHTVTRQLLESDLRLVLRFREAIADWDERRRAAIGT